MANIQTKLNNINLLNKTQYDSSSKSTNELWAVDVDGDSAFKERVVGWGMPDYSRSFTISSGYNTTTDGYFEGDCNSSGNYKIIIGGVTITDRVYSNTMVGFPFSIAVPKGTTIEFTSIGVPKFIPCKGV